MFAQKILYLFDVYHGGGCMCLLVSSQSSDKSSAIFDVNTIYIQREWERCNREKSGILHKIDEGKKEESLSFQG